LATSASRQKGAGDSAGVKVREATPKGFNLYASAGRATCMIGEISCEGALSDCGFLLGDVRTCAALLTTALAACRFAE